MAQANFSYATLYEGMDTKFSGHITKDQFKAWWFFDDPFANPTILDPETEKSYWEDQQRMQQEAQFVLSGGEVGGGTGSSDGETLKALLGRRRDRLRTAAGSGKPRSTLVEQQKQLARRSPPRQERPTEKPFYM